MKIMISSSIEGRCEELGNKKRAEYEMEVNKGVFSWDEGRVLYGSRWIIDGSATCGCFNV